MSKKKKRKSRGVAKPQNAEFPPISLRELVRAHPFQLVVLLVLPFVLYWQTLDYAYVLDDKLVLSENAFVKQGVAGIPDLLTKGAFDGYQYYNAEENPLTGGRYRPLSLVSFAMEYELFASEDAAATNLETESTLLAVNHFLNIFEPSD